MKFVIFLLGFCACVSKQPSANNTAAMTTPSANIDSPKSIHSFTVAGLDGTDISFAAFKGKKILIVNTASECGYTPQYKALETLFEQHKDKLVVVGFPANDFGGQEPGSNNEIKSFCTKNYGVTFPLAAKSAVTGAEISPIYQWLTQKEKNGVLNAEIKWNFNKFLLDENGFILQKFDSKTDPLSEEILKLL